MPNRRSVERAGRDARRDVNERHYLARLWAKCRGTVFVVAGAAVSLMWLGALGSSVPPRDAVVLEAQAVAALHRGAETLAKADFLRVIRVAPSGYAARLGLACVLWDEHQRSNAAIELLLAIEDGLLYPADAGCGAGRALSNAFERETAGIDYVYLLPRWDDGGDSRDALAVARIPDDALSTPLAVDARRVMAASCLAWRAGLYSLAAQYADVAASAFGASQPQLRSFLRCIGPSRLADVRCASIAVHLGQCEFLATIADRIATGYRLGHI